MAEKGWAILDNEIKPKIKMDLRTDAVNNITKYIMETVIENTIGRWEMQQTRIGISNVE